MTHHSRSITSIAASAAAFVLTTASAFAASAPEGSTGTAVAADDTVHCYGINSCKGSSDCKTTTQECKGMNACAGHGFKAVAAGECLAKKGTIGDL